MIVLMYHHVLPTETEHSVTPKQFKEQLILLKSKGYSFVNADHIESYVSIKNKKTIAITFDDGWLDNWAYAVPILEELKIPATIFLVTKWPQEGEKRTLEQITNLSSLTHHAAMQKIRNNEYDNVIMRWSEVQQLARNSLFSIQSHSHEHGDNWLNLNDIAAIKKDLKASKYALKKRLGINSKQLSWPRGKFSSKSYEIAKVEGYQFQYSTIMGINNSRNLQTRLIRRLNVSNVDANQLDRSIKYVSVPIFGSLLSIAHKLKAFVRLRSDLKLKHISIWLRL